MEKQEIRTFGRIHGKRLSGRQQWLVDNVLPLLDVSRLTFHENNAERIILEIGFGAGEHLRDLSIANPDSIVIGAEPFINGVASLLSAITSESDNSIKTEYKNIRIWPDDVRELLKTTTPSAGAATPSPAKGNSPLHIPHSTLMQNPYLRFAQIWVLHPDPWPKSRHEKRRLLNSDFLNLLASRLDDDGRIIIGTDHHEYYDWIVTQAKKTNLIADSRYQIADIIQTRYQQKNMAGTSAPKYLVLKK